MNVTHDIIAAVTGPGWKFGLSRILINDEGEGVVFIAGSQEPFATFAVKDAPANRAGSRGSGVSEEGDIVWRRRGSSCQYKLAKCKISTETMTTWWENSLLEPAEPETVELPDEDVVEEPEAGEEPAEEDTQKMEPVPEGSAAEVLAWVDGDVDRAQAALDAENAGKQRVGLTGDLEKILVL